MTRSTSDLPRHHAAAHVALGHDQRAVLVHVHRDPLHAVDRDPSAERLGQRTPALTDRRPPFGLEPRPPGIERLQQRRQQRVGIHAPTGGQADRRRALGQVGGKHALREVDADAEDDQG
jgi:hypothetical protein